MEEVNGFLNKLKQSTLFKAVAAYAAISFVFVQVASLVSDTFGSVSYTHLTLPTKA